MDSVSQFMLGAAIGEATLGRKIGRKALILGGALGTLPDLDVLVHYTDAVESFTYHRSWSHSIFTLTLLSPFLAWILHRYWPSKWLPELPSSSHPNNNSSPNFKEWLLCTWLVLITHPLLDGFTVYGTQLLWPLPTIPIAWGSLFIIDPLYTVPLIVAVWIAWRNRSRATSAVCLGLFISTCYIGVSLASQQHARTVAIKSLMKQGYGTENVLIAPAPLSVLWRIVSMEENQFHEGFYSIFDKDHELQFDSYPTHRDVINANYDRWPVQRLDWFTQGRISATIENDRIIINDLRMGVESSYVFRFDVGAQVAENEAGTQLSELLPIEINQERMQAILKRVWNENQILPTPSP